MEQFQVIRRPFITEKGTQLRDQVGAYIFEVDRRANKYQIKDAVEALFKVNVLGIKTLNVRGKIKRLGRSVGKRPNFKKAYVTVKSDQKIEFFEGV